MKIIYCFLVVITSLCAMELSNHLFGISGLIIMGFSIVIFFLAYFRWEFYVNEMESKSQNNIGKLTHKRKETK